MHYVIWFVTPITDQQLNFHHKMPTWNKNPLSNIFAACPTKLAHMFNRSSKVCSRFICLSAVKMREHVVFSSLGLWVFRCFGSDLWEVKCCEDETIQIPTWSQLAPLSLHFLLVHLTTWTNNQQIVSNCNLYLFSLRHLQLPSAIWRFSSRRVGTFRGFGSPKMAARPSIGKRLLSAPAPRPTVVFKVFIFHVAETEAAPFLQHQQSSLITYLPWYKQKSLEEKFDPKHALLEIRMFWTLYVVLQVIPHSVPIRACNIMHLCRYIFIIHQWYCFKALSFVPTQHNMGRSDYHCELWVSSSCLTLYHPMRPAKYPRFSQDEHETPTPSAKQIPAAFATPSARESPAPRRPVVVRPPIIRPALRPAVPRATPTLWQATPGRPTMRPAARAMPVTPQTTPETPSTPVTPSFSSNVPEPAEPPRTPQPKAMPTAPPPKAMPATWRIWAKAVRLCCLE